MLYSYTIYNVLYLHNTQEYHGRNVTWGTFHLAAMLLSISVPVCPSSTYPGEYGAGRHGAGPCCSTDRVTTLGQQLLGLVTLHWVCPLWKCCGTRRKAGVLSGWWWRCCGGGSLWRRAGAGHRRRRTRRGAWGGGQRGGPWPWPWPGSLSRGHVGARRRGRRGHGGCPRRHGGGVSSRGHGGCGPQGVTAARHGGSATTRVRTLQGWGRHWWGLSLPLRGTAATPREERNHIETRWASSYYNPDRLEYGRLYWYRGVVQGRRTWQDTTGQGHIRT